MKLYPVIIAAFLISGSACAAGEIEKPVIDPYLPTRPDSAAEYNFISKDSEVGKRLSAAGRLYPAPSGGGCTAEVIASDPPPPKDAPALLLTAGHCNTWSGTPNEVIIHQKTTGIFVPAYFRDNTEKFREYHVAEIVYSTQKVTDIAILRLEETYGDLLNHGIKPLTLTRWNSNITDVESAHGAMGFWLQHSECNASDQVAIAEVLDNDARVYPFFWTKHLSTNCPGMFGGSSGAAVVKKGTTEVLAVVSTGIVMGALDCNSNGCEIIDGQRIPLRGPIYMAPTDALIAALLPDGSVDVSKLDPGTGVGLIPQGRWRTVADPANPQSTRWNVGIDSGFEKIRFKTGIAGVTHCNDSAGYSRDIQADPDALLKLPIPVRPGPTVHVMCVVGKRPDSDQWQKYEHATSVLREVDLPVVREKR